MSVAIAVPISLLGLSGLVVTSAPTVSIGSTDVVAAQQGPSSVIGLPEVPSGLSDAPAGLPAAIRDDLGLGHLGAPGPDGFLDSGLQLGATYTSAGVRLTGIGFQLTVGRGSIGRSGQCTCWMQTSSICQGVAFTAEARSKSPSVQQRLGSSNPSTSLDLWAVLVPC